MSAVWKKEIELTSGQWGIDVPSCRIKGNSPTFGEVVLFFFKKSTTNNTIAIKTPLPAY